MFIFLILSQRNKDGYTRTLGHVKQENTQLFKHLVARLDFFFNLLNIPAAYAILFTFTRSCRTIFSLLYMIIIQEHIKQENTQIFIHLVVSLDYFLQFAKHPAAYAILLKFT